jgi:HEAT repeat protein
MLSCGGASREIATMHSVNPLDRALAAVQAANSGNAQSVGALVDLLEDPDPGVRMYAILALRRLTGEDYGYRFYESVTQRNLAVARWREALRQGKVRVRSGLAAQTPHNGPSSAGTPESTP